MAEHIQEIEELVREVPRAEAPRVEELDWWQPVRVAQVFAPVALDELRRCVRSAKFYLALVALALGMLLLPRVMTWAALGFASTAGMGFGVPTGLYHLVPEACSKLERTSKIYGTGSWAASAFAYSDTLWPMFWWATGAALGELPLYFVARSGQKYMAHLASKFLDLEGTASLTGRLMSKLRQKPWRVTFLLSCWPNPAFDVCGLLAGINGVSGLVFLSATWAGKTLVKAPILELPFFLSLCATKETGGMRVVPEYVRQICAWVFYGALYLFIAASLARCVLEVARAKLYDHRSDECRSNAQADPKRAE